MIGEVTSWNPDLGPDMAKRLLNNSYRRVVDSRLWHGLLTRSIVNTPAVYTTGSATVTTGSSVVTGTGTNWTPDMVGRSFRIGRTTYGPYLVVNVPSPTTLWLDMVWQFQSYATAGYSINGNIVSFGANVKYIKSAYNPVVGWRLWVNQPQEVINVSDPWRAAIGQPWSISPFVMSSSGGPLYELYPMPISIGAIPALCYIQPPDLDADEDTPYAFIRSDILVNEAISKALVFRGPKQNKYYDASQSMVFEKQFQMELMKAAKNDDNLSMQDLIWEFNKWPMASPGMDWAQVHADQPGEFGF
jgi:hypothetical protein